MEKITAFKTSDGKIFDNESDAKSNEVKVKTEDVSKIIMRQLVALADVNIKDETVEELGLALAKRSVHIIKALQDAQHID